MCFGELSFGRLGACFLLCVYLQFSWFCFFLPVATEKGEKGKSPFLFWWVGKRREDLAEEAIIVCVTETSSEKYLPSSGKNLHEMQGQSNISMNINKGTEIRLSLKITFRPWLKSVKAILNISLSAFLDADNR